MIKDEDISIVVQGPILTKSAYNITDKTTQFICKRVRQLFPKSELILSTWEGSNVDNISHDVCLFNKDPGATNFIYNGHLLNNCNRLIVSTCNGVRAAKRKYVLKIRSDLFIVSKSFLTYFNKFQHFDSDCKFVKNRIIAFSLDTIKSHKTCLFSMIRPYHVSDWAYFGYKEDILNLYDIPLVKEPEFSQHFLYHYKDFFDIHPDRLWRMPPEQYVTVSFLNKHTPINFNHTVDTSHNNVEKSQRLLANNFLVLDQTQFNLISLKYVKLQLLFPALLSRTAIFYHTWLKDYYIYCQVPFSIMTIGHKIQSLWRYMWYGLFNAVLRVANHKHNFVNRLVAAWLKKVG